MEQPADRVFPGWDFTFATAQRPRALWARTRLSLKRFLIGAPEDALLAVALADRTRTHVAVVGLLTLPLFVAWLPGGGVGRWAVLFSMLSGLLVAARLESTDHSRVSPLATMGAGLLYAIALSGMAWELLGPAALRVDPQAALCVVVAGLAALATRCDPRLCAVASGVGVLSIGGLHVFGSNAITSAGAAPALITVAGAGIASTLAAARGQSIQRLAILDSASGALHAVAFERCLRSAQQRARAVAKPITLAKIEFSALREIRETHGPALADALLKWLASVLNDRFRATDLLGRTGNEEFSLALLDTDHPGVARRLDRLRQELHTIELSRGGLREPVALRVAFGLAAMPREIFDPAAAEKLVNQRLALARWQSRQAA